MASNNTELGLKKRAIKTDLVVMGGGGSGLAAAIAAKENGAKVLLLEKGAKRGGDTALAGASLPVIARL